MTLMGLVDNYAGLLAARFFLGLTEAGLYPGANYYLSCWYKRSELGMRTAIFFAMAALAGSFGGLLAAAISQMDGIGNTPGWAWIVSAHAIHNATIEATYHVVVHHRRSRHSHCGYLFLVDGKNLLSIISSETFANYTQQLLGFRLARHCSLSFPRRPHPSPTPPHGRRPNSHL
jgi:MFS family permease